MSVAISFLCHPERNPVRDSAYAPSPMAQVRLRFTTLRMTTDGAQSNPQGDAQHRDLQTVFDNIIQISPSWQIQTLLIKLTPTLACRGFPTPRGLPRQNLKYDLIIVVDTNESYPNKDRLLPAGASPINWDFSVC